MLICSHTQIFIRDMLPDTFVPLMHICICKHMINGAHALIHFCHTRKCDCSFNEPRHKIVANSVVYRVSCRT